jgi:MerR family transcriptional regulator, copper efflux regulator
MARPGLSISLAARRLGTTPRMLRYREQLGLMPPTHHGMRHRRYTENDLRAAALAIAIENRYDVGPNAVAFGLRALVDPVVEARLRELGERTGRLTPATRALDFDTQKALRLLRRGR